MTMIYLLPLLTHQPGFPCPAYIHFECATPLRNIERGVTNKNYTTTKQKINLRFMPTINRVVLFYFQHSAEEILMSYAECIFY